ncbi:MAG: hypothetical protein ACOYW3_10990 [Bacteroidota bacterium]
MTLTIPTSELLIFKTNIETDSDVAAVARVLALTPRVRRWNVDRDDVDRVLRVEGNNLDAILIATQLAGAGFTCTELSD